MPWRLTLKRLKGLEIEGKGRFIPMVPPCTMCGGACVYIMLPQQRMYRRNLDEEIEVPKDTPAIPSQESKSAK